eukprot:Opistho-1_new@64568
MSPRPPADVVQTAQRLLEGACVRPRRPMVGIRVVSLNPLELLLFLVVHGHELSLRRLVNRRLAHWGARSPLLDLDYELCLLISAHKVTKLLVAEELLPRPPQLRLRGINHRLRCLRAREVLVVFEDGLHVLVRRQAHGIGHCDCAADGRNGIRNHLVRHTHIRSRLILADDRECFRAGLLNNVRIVLDHRFAVPPSHWVRVDDDAAHGTALLPPVVDIVHLLDLLRRQALHVRWETHAVLCEVARSLAKALYAQPPVVYGGYFRDELVERGIARRLKQKEALVAPLHVKDNHGSHVLCVDT